MSMAHTQADPMSFPRVRASTLHGPKDLRIEHRGLLPPHPDDIQVAIRTVTLCGSDVHYYTHFRNGDIRVLEPLTLGHEAAGVITAVGAASRTKWKVGDRVALEVGVPCGICRSCKEGRYNICPEMRFRSSARGFPHAQGCLQERLNQSARWVHRLPEEVSLEMGALLEPLGVAIHAGRRAGLQPGSRVLVFGAGAVGLLTAAVVRMGDTDAKIVIADVDRGRVEFATRNGFAHAGFVVDAARYEKIEEQLASAQDVAAKIGGVDVDGDALGQVDAVFECTGVPSCLQTAIYATRSGGKVMLIGMGTPIQTLPVSAAALREVDIIGVFRYANTYPAGIELFQRAQRLLNDGQDVPRFDKLITHRYRGFEGIEDAFKMAARTTDEQGNLVLKVLVELNEETSDQAKL